MKLKLPKFIPGETYIPSSGKVFDHEEIDNAIQAAKDGWWTEGEFGKQFESDFKKVLGVKCVSLTNSGSSANLLAVAALTSKVFGDRRLQRGDEYITTPVAFPTTVNPGIMYGLKPVFVDVEIDTLNIDANQIEKGISKKTKLIMVAHTLGKPFDMDKIMYLVKKYNLWLVEDCCDALGATYNGQLLGTFGHMATFSHYPAHQVTMGEGGTIVTNNPLLHRSIRQFRDWGRDCWCDTGKDNTCGRRFQWQLGNLPMGYDHKYIYSQIGFNLKLTDFQAAIGVAQLKKLPVFVERRRENFNQLYKIFSKYDKFFTLMNVSNKENPSWFGFPVVIKDGAPFSRVDITTYLENNKVGTRTLFSGNLLNHPAYIDVKYRKVGKMKNADKVMFNTFWVGVYPGIDDKRVRYMGKMLDNFMAQYK